MTTTLVILLIIVLAELAFGVRTWRSGRTTQSPPPSHPEWSSGGLPSHPYGG